MVQSKKRQADTSEDVTVDVKKVKVAKKSKGATGTPIGPPAKGQSDPSNTKGTIDIKTAPALSKPPPPLGRIVIPALVHKTKQGTFTYRGADILKDSIPFSHCVSSSLPPQTPVLTKAGKVAKRQPVPDKQTVVWWKAQCVFRGLSSQGNIVDLQERLRPAQDNGMSEVLRALEQKLDAEFRQKNADALEERWINATSDDQKVEDDAERFLRETFLGVGPARDAVALKNVKCPRDQLGDIAVKLGLAYQSTETPSPTSRHSWNDDKWIVVGPTRAGVSAKVQEIHDESNRRRQAAQDAKEEKIKQQQAQLLRQENANPNAEWDVSGTWVIDCPYVQQQWGNGSKDECELIITFGPASEGMRMWATFRFVVLTGVFRFGRLGEVLEVGDDLDDDDDDEHEEDYSSYGDLEESDEDRPKTKPKPKCAASPAPQFPVARLSATNHKWDYQWRGSETGEGELQLDFDCQKGCIMFGGPGGTKLVGEFESGLTSKIEFTGRKVSGRVGFSAEDLTFEWANSDEREHERQRLARW